MRLRRFAWYFIAGLLVAAALWVLALRVTRPLPADPAHRFDVAVSSGGSARPHAVDYARLDARLNRLMADPAMVGLAVGIVEDGQIRFIKGYGVTFAGGREPVTADTVFRWASLSKGVAADMVASLANDGRLSLGDPVARYASSLRLPGGNEQVASVANLLSHSLGLFGHAQDAKLEDGLEPHYLRGTLATLHNICAPGTCHAYQNVAYDAASEIVERVTGRPYGEVVRERFFAPLGMTGASVSRAALVGAQSWARPHVGGHPRGPEEVADIYYRVPASGGVNGTIKDLAIWMLAQMGLAADVLPPAVLAAVQTPQVRTPGENFRRRKFRERTAASAYGLGWRILDYAGHRVVGHHGGVRGYRSMILFDPRLRAGVVVLWNSSSPRPNAIEYEVMDMIYRLPFRDWLELDKAPEVPENPNGNLAHAENEGG
ncbi:MAG TPA: serine hydrolase domain-containing protein [Allosphingosinicella sp.]|nr:serine hydrolase domain-containing protein [Allosphingosinicella sp.]